VLACKAAEADLEVERLDDRTRIPGP
jgi:hypothetical protein